MSRLCLCLLVLAAYAAAQRNPFLPSTECRLCHSRIEYDSRPVAQYTLWSASTMAHSARDPYWRAQVNAEVAAAPQARGAIEDKCLSCHAPMQHRLVAAGGRTLALASLDELGADGISCTLCHQIEPAGLGQASTFTARFAVGAKSLIYGPHQDPFTMPMLHHTGYTATYAPHILEAALCGSCHTVITRALGARTDFVEQAPYLEWLRSRFPSAQRTCQSCHLPLLRDAQGRDARQYIAHNPAGRWFPPTSPRAPFGRHLFAGANQLLGRLLSSADASRNHELLATAATLSANLHPGASHALLDVTVHNRTGHKLPTAYPSRRLWLHVIARDATGTVVFESGGGDPAPSPHRDTISRPSEAAVWEATLAAQGGEPTTRLLAAVAWRKDNRILPEGYDPQRALPASIDASVTRPVGVQGDRDFLPGSDTVHYRLPPGTRSVSIELLYQTTHARHLAGLDFPLPPDALAPVRLATVTARAESPEGRP